MLRNVVMPVDGSQDSLTPLEIFIDTIGEIGRLDSALGESPFTPEDYRAVADMIGDFMTSKTRGMEQLYEIVRHRHGEP